MLSGTVHQRILIDPAHAGCIRPECRTGVRGQGRRHLAQVLENPRARPVKVRAILEDDVDEGIVEERVPAYRGGPRNRQHCRGQRVGDLVLDHLRCLSGVGGLDDYLDVGEVGNGV